MKIAIIVSTEDIAGINIKERLIEIFNPKAEGKFDNYDVYSIGKAKLYTLSTETIFRENIDKEIDADFFIFATRHQSKSQIPSLSVHSPGNWANAEYGGKDKTLCIAPALFLRKAYQLLAKAKLEGFDVVNECTHHGPYLEKPVMFIEIGSNETSWKNKEAGIILAKIIYSLITEKIEEAEKIAIGIGGQHTCSNFNKLVLKGIAIGHVCPKYNLQNLNKEMILQAIDKTIPKPNMILLDYKGLGEEKQRIKLIAEEAAKERNITLERTQNL